MIVSLSSPWIIKDITLHLNKVECFISNEVLYQVWLKWVEVENVESLIQPGGRTEDGKDNKIPPHKFCNPPPPMPRRSMHVQRHYFFFHIYVD